MRLPRKIHKDDLGHFLAKRQDRQVFQRVGKLYVVDGSACAVISVKNRDVTLMASVHTLGAILAIVLSFGIAWFLWRQKATEIVNDLEHLLARELGAR